MRSLKIERMRLSELTPNGENPRRISAEALKGLQASIERFGYVEPIIVNTKTKRVVGGHQRLKALLAAGIEEAEVLKVSLPPNAELALNISLNNPAIQGTYTDELQDWLEKVKPTMEGAYAEIRLDELEDPLGASRLHPDRIKETGITAAGEPISQRGDVWIAGPHRIACGDATNPDEVAALLGGATPGLMVTDPPYGVNYDPTWRKVLGGKQMRQGPSTNDDRGDWREAYHLFPGEVAYVWHAALQGIDVWEGLEDAGMEIRQQIIWHKQRFVLSRGAYHWQHELALYAVRKGTQAAWRGGSDQGSIWPIDNHSAYGGNGNEDSTNHSAQKPIECMARPIRHHDGGGHPGVYDPFLGSGTTWMAAEEGGRPCYGMDIHPGWVDAAITRWIQRGGEAPRRERDEANWLTAAGADGKDTTPHQDDERGA